MKIEKVNDHQIRCTLTKDDLASREIKLSELAYGTDKAKDLFRDMMQQANFQYGFETEDIPLMIEAIPLNSECIVLIITKVEDPEELDTRFSKFAPSVHEDENSEEDESSYSPDSADDVLELFKKIKDSKSEISDSKEKKAFHGEEVPVTLSTSDNITKMYLFTSLSTITNLAHVLQNCYEGTNTLYKNSSDGHFTLILSKGGHTPEEFNKVCNILSEYGSGKSYSRASEAFLAEHCELLIQDSALQTLAKI